MLPLPENLFVLSLVLNPKYTEIRKQYNQNIQTIAQFLRTISLTLNQLEHYSFHTSKKTYFRQTKPTLCQLNRASPRQVDKPTNIPKTSGGNLRKSKFLGRFCQSWYLHIVGLSNTLNYDWDYAYAKEFPVEVVDVNAVPCTITDSKSEKSTAEVTGQDCQHNCAGQGK